MNCVTVLRHLSPKAAASVDHAGDTHLSASDDGLFLDLPCVSRDHANRAAAGLTRHGWTVLDHGSEEDVDGDPLASAGPYFVQAVKIAPASHASIVSSRFGRAVWPKGEK